MTVKRCTKCGETKPLDGFTRRRDSADGLHPWCRDCTRAYEKARGERRASHVVAPPSKVCAGCGETKPRDAFTANPTSRGGLRRRCKACEVRAAQESRRRDPATARARDLAQKWKHIDNIRAKQRERWREKYAAASADERDAYRAKLRARYTPRPWPKLTDEEKIERRRGWQRSHYYRHREEILAKLKTPEMRAYVGAMAHLRHTRERLAPGDATNEQVLARIAYFGFCCWMCGAPWQQIDHVKPIAKGGSKWAANLRPSCTTCNRRKHARIVDATPRCLPVPNLP